MHSERRAHTVVNKTTELRLEGKRTLVNDGDWPIRTVSRFRIREFDYAEHVRTFGTISRMISRSLEEKATSFIA